MANKKRKIKIRGQMRDFADLRTLKATEIQAHDPSKDIDDLRWRYKKDGDIEFFSGDPGDDDIVFGGSKSDLRRIEEIERNISVLATKVVTASDPDNYDSDDDAYGQVFDDHVRFKNKGVRFSSSNVSFDGSTTLHFGNRKLAAVDDPTSAQDAATKNYVDTNFLGVTGGTISSNLTITGNLTVNGSTTTLSSTNTTVTDSLMMLNSGTTGSNSKDVGLVIDRGDDTNAAFIWDESSDRFAFITTTEDGTTAGNVSRSTLAPIHVGSAFIENSNSNASAGPDLTLRRNSASPANSDELGQIISIGKNSADGDTIYGKIVTKIKTVTDGSEDGVIEIQTMAGGSLASSARINDEGIHLPLNRSLFFEGSADDAHETQITVTNPTADRTITFPDSTGEVLLTTSTLSQLSNVATTSPSDGQYLVYDSASSKWAPETLTNNSSYTYTAQGSAPGSPTDGDEWYDTDTGDFYKYINDGTTKQWVEWSPATNGMGWSGGSYDAGSGVVTFTSDHGLGFTTGDLRGADAVLDGSMNITGNIRADADNSRALGTSSYRFSAVHAVTFTGQATSAQYADLAEWYAGDKDYEVGTVVVVGGDKEVTECTKYGQSSLAGVVSGEPGFVMNKDIQAEHPVCVGFVGRVPVKVHGPIEKGDLITTSMTPGVGTKLVSGTYQPGCVIGVALDNYNNTEVGTIEVLLKRS